MHSAGSLWADGEKEAALALVEVTDEKGTHEGKHSKQYKMNTEASSVGKELGQHEGRSSCYGNLKGRGSLRNERDFVMR